MSLEGIAIKDADGVSRTVLADSITGGFVQALKLLLGADGADGTLIAAGAQLLAASMPVNDTPNSAATSTAVAVTTTAALLSSPATNRRRLMLFNNGTKTVFVGASGVTASTGWPVFPGTGYEFHVGPGLILHGVSEDGSSQDCRILELA